MAQYVERMKRSEAMMFAGGIDSFQKVREWLEPFRGTISWIPPGPKQPCTGSDGEALLLTIDEKSLAVAAGDWLVYDSERDYVYGVMPIRYCDEEFQMIYRRARKTD